MYNEEQRKIVKKLLKRYSIRHLLKDYKFFSQEYLSYYMNWKNPRTKKMDEKILQFLLDIQDDNFEMLQEISKKAKKTKKS